MEFSSAASLKNLNFFLRKFYLRISFYWAAPITVFIYFNKAVLFIVLSFSARRLILTDIIKNILFGRKAFKKLFKKYIVKTSIKTL